MQDSQDNTFPIPQSDDSNNQVGGSVPSPSDNQMNPSIMPGTSINPTDTPSAPSQPDWQTVAAQDSAQLNPVINAPVQSTDPAMQYDNSLPATPAMPNNDATLPPQQPGPLPLGDTNGVPVQPIDPQNNYNGQYNTVLPQANPSPTVPANNMLDLSSAPQPAIAAQAPVNDQFGMMQPGVDVTPAPNMIDNSAVPPGFGGNLGIGDMAAPVPPPSNNKKKFIIIGAVVIAFILVLSLILVLMSSSKKSPAVELDQQQVDQAQQAADTAPSDPAAIPDGFKKIDRDCFSFGAFVPNTINVALSQCKITARFGSVSQYEISILPVTTSVTDLQSLVDQAKVGTITTQTDIKLNNVAAKQVIQKVNGLDQQSVVVIPDVKNYQIDGQPINGFIITTSYNDDSAKKASDTLVSTWTWKQLANQ